MQDKRKLKCGTFIRQFSIDELPQLINVLLGDMSIVGPRPHMVGEDMALEGNLPRYKMRRFVKPGITGLAQVEYIHAHNDIEAAGRLEFDMDYIRSSNFLLDIKIILLTIKRSLRLGGS